MLAFATSPLCCLDTIGVLGILPFFCAPSSTAILYSTVLYCNSPHVQPHNRLVSLCSLEVRQGHSHKVVTAEDGGQIYERAGYE